MATPRIRGDTTIRERPDSPDWGFDTQKITCTRTFEGMYADLLAGRPGIGDTMSGYENLYVEDVRIKRAVSGKATMTVILEVQIVPVTNPPLPAQPVYEIEWVQLERPIEQNPAFKTLFPDPTGAIQFSADQITALNNFNAWENAVDAPTRASTYAALTADFQALAQKKMRGQTTYLLFAPLARITTLAREVTLATACGKVFSAVPDFTELPGGYLWLSTADRSTRTGTYGKWQRVQEWTGADSWDATIYPSGD
jgi:hypothetical protein